MVLDYIDAFNAVLALCLTSSAWRAQVLAYVARKLRVFLPLSHQHIAAADRLKVSARFIDARTARAELQLYDFQQGAAKTLTTEPPPAPERLSWGAGCRAEFLPWNTNAFVAHLATTRTSGARTVVDPSRVRLHSLGQQDPVFERVLPEGATLNCFAFNARCKCSIECLSQVSNSPSPGQYFGFCWCTKEERTFAVYSVDDEATSATLVANETYDWSPPDFFEVTMVIRGTESAIRVGV